MTHRPLWAAVLVLIGGLAACKKTPAAPPPSIPGAPGSTQVLRNFQMQDIQDGAKTMILESDEGHVVDKDTAADVHAPKVTFFKKGVLSSVLTAPLGHINMESHEVVTWGGVTVVTPDSTTLTTERLRYDPVRQLLVSTETVRLEKPDSVTDGVGLEAQPDLSRVLIGHEKVHVKPKPHA